MDHENSLTAGGATKRRALGSILILASILAALTLCVSFAHGVVGNRIFLSPIVGNDAFPDNALDSTMRRSNYEFLLLPALEKQLSENSSLLFLSSRQRVTPGTGQREQEGFGDLSIYYRQGGVHLGSARNGDYLGPVRGLACGQSADRRSGLYSSRGVNCCSVRG